MWQIKRGDTPLYIAGMPPRTEQPRRDHFHGLASEINEELTIYRHYKMFEPWPLPSIYVSWDETKGAGRVEGVGELRIQLQSLGQAQAWFGESYGVIWECYFHETRRREANWREELAEFWRAVEKDLGVSRIFTEPHEPTFEEGYTDFLARLEYTRDADNPRWWSKETKRKTW